MERAAQNHLIELAGKISRKQRAEEREKLKREKQEAEWKDAQSLLPNQEALVTRQMWLNLEPKEVVMWGVLLVQLEKVPIAEW